MLFYSVFKDLVDKNITVTVELKNNLMIQGKLEFVDDKMNFNLTNINIDLEKYPQFASIKNCFIRGSSVRYVHLPASEIETD